MQPYPNCLACGHATYVTAERFAVCPHCELISAINRKTTQVYDEKYVADRYQRYDTTIPMSKLRYRILMGVLELEEAAPAFVDKPTSGRLLDVGYGDGSFIRCANSYGWSSFGNDVNPTDYPGVRPVPLPIGHERRHSDRYKVVTFFDCLEHFEELAGVRRVAMNTDYILLSYPKYPAAFLFDPDSWKHCRPGEHHHFFTPRSLENLFTDVDYRAEIAYVGYPEDAIRGKLGCGSPNIETVALRIRRYDPESQL